jgi:Ca2+-binding RTX toxin-like protein
MRASHRVGGTGDDFLHGGGGRDILTGSASRDMFAFGSLQSRPGGGARDLITGFQRGIDIIDFSLIGALEFDDLIFTATGGRAHRLCRTRPRRPRSGGFGVQLTGVISLEEQDFILI